MQIHKERVYGEVTDDEPLKSSRPVSLLFPPHLLLIFNVNAKRQLPLLLMNETRNYLVPHG